MSSNDKEHRITYKAGITRKPSDFLCQDGELAECINLTTDNEELKTIVQPTLEFTRIGSGVSAKIVYIHKLNNQQRYIKIFKPSQTWQVQWWDEKNQMWKLINKDGTPITLSSSDARVTSVGKILIIADDNGIQYFRWQEGSYKVLGQLPVPDIDFFLMGTLGAPSVRNSQSCEGILDQNNVIEDGKQEAYNDLVIGLYEKNKKNVAQKKGFCEPFFVRTALELYDGTYTHISQPILMFPAITQNSWYGRNSKEAFLSTAFCSLFYNNMTDLSDWSDIIKDVVVFVSDGIDIYDLTVDQPAPSAVTEDNPLYNGIFRTVTSPNDYYRVSSETAFLHALKRRDVKDIENDIKAASVFYRLCGIGINGDRLEHNIAENISVHTLENLTTQKRLENDDYFSRSKMYASVLYSYNSRLNIANVSRSFFEGYDKFLPYENTSSNYYTFYVTISTDEGDKTVKHEKSTTQKQGIYFYYPDARAKHVMIFKKRDSSVSGDGTCILNTALKEHTGLNGAYYFKGLPQANEREDAVSGDAPENYTYPDPEMLPNYIITSEVNNPFVFLAQGYNKVGTGKIEALSTTTMALSQDQFGKTDLIVFSESGVWGLQVDGTGLFSSIHPITRDVIINPNNIIQTDGAVYFVSKKGLMVISERVQNGVQCVSERMNGKVFNTSTLTNISAGTDWNTIVTTCQDDDTFQKYICAAKTMMAYDYIDNLIIITNPDYNYSYIHNIADGSIAKNILPAKMINVVNNYPDYLMQSESALYSLYKKPREEESNARRRAFILTRPMKLAGPVSKASLRQLMNVGMWGSDSVVETKLYLSDNLRTWYEDISRFGTAAKYYRIALYLYMLPTERLSGTIITTQDRRTNNLR